MLEKIKEYPLPYPSQIGLVVQDIRTGARLEINPDRVFPSASIIKVPIMWEFYRRVALGLLDPSAPYVLKDGVKVGETPYDTGILRDLHDGLVLTLEDIVTMMIVISDDTATNILLDLLGQERINRTIQELGMKDTRVQRRMMEYEKVRAGIDNMTSAGDMAQLLLELLRGEKLPRAYCDKMLSILSRQRYVAALPQLLPEKVKIAHKTGSIGEFGLEHDIGILYREDGSPGVLVSAMTQHLPDSLGVIGTIGKMAYEECCVS